MSISEVYEHQLAIAQREFKDIIAGGSIWRLSNVEALKLRLQLIDDSCLEANVSSTERYSYHWERRLIGHADFYRFDNGPHVAWKNIASFPAHFHNGSNEQVEASYVSREPSEAIRQVLTFIRNRIREERLKQQLSDQ